MLIYPNKICPGVGFDILEHIINIMMCVLKEAMNLVLLLLPMGMMICFLEGLLVIMLILDLLFLESLIIL